MSERTSGPWTFYESPDVSRYAITNDGGVLAIADLPYDYPLVYPSPDVQLSNARFIAAAPDMEKALEAWLEWDGEIGEGPSPPMLARAALAKAQGESNATHN